MNAVDRFTAETAAKTGRSETSIKRDAERGSKVCQAALDVLKGTRADTGAVLARLKDLPVTRQVEIARQEVQHRSRPVNLTSSQCAARSLGFCWKPTNEWPR